MSTATFEKGSFYPIQKEFESVELGDKRLGRRLSFTAKKLNHNVGQTINHAFATWGDTKGAYRFFSNPHVVAEEIQSVHVEQTKQRMQESQSPYLLVVEDKSTLNFSEHPRTKNLGPIGHKVRKNRTPVQGIYFHGAMVYTPQGVALGLLNQTFWVRPGYGKLTVRRYGQYYKIPRTQKESFRFVEPILICHDLQEELGVRLVVVSDREADINEFLEEALTGHVGFVVRAHERRLCVEEEGHIVDYLQRSQKPQAKLKLKVLRRKILTRKQTQWIKPTRQNGEWRTAELELYWGRVTLPLRFDGAAGSFREHLCKREVTAIWVKEKRKPGRKRFEPIDWLLLTDKVIETRLDALEVIKIYQKRWNIEIYHRILKSGCKVEECRLSEKERLVRYLYVMGVVAWRIQALIQLARNNKNPNVDASICLEDSEVKALRLKYKIKKKKLHLDESMILIARLGGFLARKGDKDPGPKALWSGMQRLIFIAEGVALAEKRIQNVGNR